MSDCGAAYSLGPKLIVSCQRGNHENHGEHQGRLADSDWDLRWPSIGNEPLGWNPYEMRLVRRADEVPV